MSEVLKLETLKNAVAGAAGLRSISELEPAGGSGDKVFPPTYEKGEYAKEMRLIDGVRVPCVLLDSVASQANRIELALLRAHRRGDVSLPIIEVDFSKEFPDLRTITQFEAPHRISDAILRDSTDVEGKRFRKRRPVSPSPAPRSRMRPACSSGAQPLFCWGCGTRPAWARAPD